MSVSAVQEVFREVFEQPTLDIHAQMTAKDVKDWDSFNHINLIVALEDRFDVVFSTEEIAGMGAVNDLITSLRQKGVDVSW